MLKFEIEVTEEEIEFSEAGETQLLQESLEALEAQALSGVDRDGAPIIGRSGKRLDLHETGRLWKNVTVVPAEEGLRFNEGYAGEVLTKYKADGLNEASQAALEERLTPMVNEQVTNKEVK